MERLTFDGNFCDIAQCASIPGGSFCEDRACSQRKVWERLKAYEDTGLEPEEIKAPFTEGTAIKLAAQALETGPSRLRELAEADRAGRLVVLPCKVGDTVWFNTYKDNGRTCIGMQPHKVVGSRVCVMAEGKIFPLELPLSRFGKNWFQTREEAENALEAMKNAK